MSPKSPYSALKTIALCIVKISNVMFGQLHWSRPAWLERALALSLGGWRKVCDWCAQNQKLVRRSAAGSAVLALLGTGGYLWWEHQPKPQLITIEVRNPAATALVDKAKVNPLKLEFNGSVAPLEQVGKVVKTGVQLAPALEGTWKWENDRILSFTPASDWPVDQKETISLDRSYFPRHLRLNTYQVDFSTPSFAVVSSQAEFYQHPEIPKEKRVVATIKVSHPVDPQSLKGKVSISLLGNTEVLGDIPREYKAELTYDKFFGEIYVRSEIMPLPLKDTRAKIVIAKGFASKRGGNRYDQDVVLETDIPGLMTYFKVGHAELKYVENNQYALEQVLLIETTSEVLEDEFTKSLEVYLLPEAPEATDHKGKRKHKTAWQTGEVTPEVLARAELLKPVRIPSERPQTTVHTFKLDVPVNRGLFVRLKKGLKSFHEYILAENFDSTLFVSPYPKEIRILHEGSILAMSGDRKLTVLTRGIDAFQVEVGHVLPDQLNHLISQTSGDFTNPRFISNYTFDWNNISEKFSEVIEVASTQDGKPEFSAFDAGKFLSKAHGGARGLLYVSLRPYNRAHKRPQGSTESRFLLVTDLGVIEKRLADKSHEVFVQSVHSGQPVAGCAVEVIGRNGVAVLTTHTDGQGRAHLPDLSDFINEKSPLAVVVQNGGDLSFLPFAREDRKLEYSRFDVGGLHTRGDEDRLQGYLFTDRGLYRPGETFHVSGVVRSFDWKTKLAGVPLEWVVSDPKDQEMYKEKVTLDKAGFLELTGGTQEAAFVGTYTAALYLVTHGKRSGLVGSTTFRVEEFVPDRMKISAGFTVAETTGWIAPEGLKAWVRVKNLFGFPAAGRRVSASYDLSPAAPHFAAYKDYAFYFPKTEKHYQENLSASESSDSGEVEYPLDLTRFESGNYNLRFEAEAFEAEGGRSVIAQATALVSPYPYFLGFKSDADLSYLKMNEAASVQFIAVNSSLKKVAVGDLTLRYVEKQWISVLTKQANGTYRYESVQRDKELKKEAWKIAAVGTALTLPVEKPGDFKLIVENSKGLEVGHLEYSVVGSGNILGKIDRNAELQIKLSRSDYSAGEAIEMQIRAPYVGAGLITIERDKVYAAKWFRTTSNNSLQTITIPPGLEGNAYVNVTFLRDLNSREIFMSPLSYGVVPFSVDMKKRVVKVNLKASAVQRPGTPLKIEYSVSKPGKIVVFAVNEGILQVAKYQTPDPLKKFFQKRALEIETAQLLDLLLPEYHIVKQLSAAGGDADQGALAHNLNPFRRKGRPPVAFWSGVIDADATTRSVIYNVPDDFSGSLRVMAVAVAPEAIGVARTDTLVRGDFMITPTVPSVLTPGDEAVIGVSVFNNAKGSGPNAKVKISVQGSDQLEVIEQPKAELEIAETKEASTTIKVRAKDKLGTASLKFAAAWQDKRAALTEEISLRPATAYRTQVWAGSLKSEAQAVALERAIYPEFAKASASVSLLPLTLAHGLAEFLNGFPYGCTEQLLSKAIPQMVLGDKPDFGYSPESRDKAFQQVLATLRQRQTSSGGFGLYWAYGEPAVFPSLYAIHYLVEAKERGLGVPLDMQERVKSYLRTFANSTARSIPDARHTAYALYLLARFGQNAGNEINTLAKEIEAAKLSKEWATDIGALFMGATYKLMRQDDLANQYAASLTLRREDLGREDYNDRYIHNALAVYLLARHFPERVAQISDAAVDSFVDMLAKQSYNSLNSALVILALDALNTQRGPVETVVNVSAVDAQGQKTALPLPKSLFPKVDLPGQAKKVEFTATSEARVFYSVSQGGFDRPEGIKGAASKIEIHREYRLPGSALAASALKLGEEAEVHLRLRSVDQKTYSDVAIVDLIPSGFEVVLERAAHQDALRCEPRKESVAANVMQWLLPRAYAQDEESSSEEENAEDGTSGPRAALEPNQESSAEAPSLAQPGSTLAVDFVDPREDRVVLYASVTPEAKEYVYRIKATNRGTFKVPPAFAEHMYDRSVQALGEPGTISVSEAK